MKDYKKNKRCMLRHHNQTGPVHKHEIIRNSPGDVGILPTYSFLFQIVWHLCVMINTQRDVELIQQNYLYLNLIAKWYIFL